MAKNQKFKTQSDISNRTLFVRGIPDSCTNEQLLEEFCKVGPTKDCFIVKPKEEKANSKKARIGYVTYLSPENAKDALNNSSQFSIEGKQLQVSYSLRKSISKKDNTSKKRNKYQSVNNSITHHTSVSNSKAKNFAKKKSFKLSVKNFPETFKKTDFLKLWKETKLIDPINVDIDNKNQTAEVIVVSKQQAHKACHHLMGKDIENCSLSVILEGDGGKSKNAQKARLIIRNLSFQCDEDHLKKVFSKFGNITDVKIPVSGNGKKRGFGFVQFTNVFESQKAMKAMNYEEIKGRKIAIDWVVKRNVFMQSSKKDDEIATEPGEDHHADEGSNSEGEKSEDEGETDEEGADSDSEDESDEDSEEEDSENENPYDKDLNTASPSKKSNTNLEEKKKSLFIQNLSPGAKEKDIRNALAGFGIILHATVLKDKDSGESRCCGFVKFESEECAIKCLESYEANGITISGSPADLCHVKSKDDITQEKNKKKESSDINEGKTVFLRNLSFDSTEDEIEDALSKFGEIVYARIVKNKGTGMSKGCAFVKFVEKESADACLQEGGEETAGILITSRLVTITHAVTRQDSDKINKEKKKKEPKEDKRNLYLAREGLIRPGTKAAEGLSEVEMKKRERIENLKRQKLKNPDIVVSRDRLCVHNLPRHVDNKKLKEIMIENNEGLRPFHITECRVMRNMKEAKENGVGRSLGFAFVQFKTHLQALSALRNVNNNPKIFDSVKRPIVEFSLENSRILKMKEMRKDRMNQRQTLKRKMNEDITPEETSSQKEDTWAETRKKKNKKTPIVLPRKNDFQGNTGTTVSGKKLPLPLHSRPKLRKKNKASVLEQLKKSKKLNDPRKRKQQSSNKRKQNERSGHGNEDEQTKSRRKKSKNNDDEFSGLVAKYTNAIMSKSSNKWFE